MYESKTVRPDSEETTIEDTIIPQDSLYLKQKEDVASMRASLLSCNMMDSVSSRIALQRITVMRVYHQVTRIIRYTEMMDKIENKLYESIDHSLETMDSANPSTWLALLNVQEKLQKSMIESHKLLQPYLDEGMFAGVEIPQPEPQQSFSSIHIDQTARDNIRSAAQNVLNVIQSAPSASEDKEVE